MTQALLALPLEASLGVLQLAVAAIILGGLIRARAVRSSPLALGTAAVFALGGLQHWDLAFGAFLPVLKPVPRGYAGSLAWVWVAWDAITVLMLAGYLQLRRGYGALTLGARAAGRAPRVESIERIADPMRRLLVDAAHSGATVGVLAFEVDGLEVFHRLGNPERADRIREDVMAVLREQMKGDDLVARFDGEDRFLVVLNTGNRDVANVVARRAAGAIERRLLDHLLDVPMRVCVGIAVRPDDGLDVDSLIEAAREALIYSRRLGGGVFTASREYETMAPPLPEEDEDALALEAMRLSVTALTAALHAHHEPTAAHSERVAALASQLAAELDYPLEDRPLLRTAALLHDIGMLAVPAELLSKTSPLSAQDYRVLRRHPRLGYELLRGIPRLQAVAPYVLNHHETGDDVAERPTVPLASRIIAVAEAYDSMHELQPWRAYRISTRKALRRLRRDSVTHFDTNVVDALARIVGHTADAGPAETGPTWRVA